MNARPMRAVQRPTLTYPLGYVQLERPAPYADPYSMATMPPPPSWFIVHVAGNLPDGWSIEAEDHHDPRAGVIFTCPDGARFRIPGRIGRLDVIPGRDWAIDAERLRHELERSTFVERLT